jgi:hypothetical protein
MKKIFCISLIILSMPIAAFAGDRITEIRTLPAEFQVEQVEPELKFFPMKISRKDILVISRSNNESNVTSLTYTITAETAVLTGSFEGNAKEMKAYVDLVTGLKGLNPVKINVVIMDNTGRVIADTDIPLVPVQ